MFVPDNNFLSRYECISPFELVNMSNDDKIPVRILNVNRSEFVLYPNKPIGHIELYTQENKKDVKKLKIS